ncbi:luciferase family oxidoreductase, group 1 [Actinacidiphila yanglinensis]|uniref:Luciferase family oxidoreductase, group 1 n=1 Tax=Actinacidiphila yanglinensis TaxID=310779 RepID=A0A1H6B013_9ACTN|nr:MsnO8 family LLM class oxidoreductase [Actinacidiphila yanglinensis]SEG54168.1 luciferase family oxidoreductase, group 1 [Actinacidiphila yanglinensis]
MTPSPGASPAERPGPAPAPAPSPTGSAPAPAFASGPADRPAPPPVPLSVLDLGAHLPGAPAEQAVLDIVETARTADACGYHRFWVAEHHASPVTASSSPAVLIATIAARTRHIRVGSGGVMLPNHAPLTVAEQFATLQALHPGRIDLGLGRFSGGTAATHDLLMAALRRGPDAAAEFPALVDELLGFLHHAGPPAHRFHALDLAPHPAGPPEVHILGASGNGARLAAERSLPFVHGHHLGRSKCRPDAVDHYRAAWTPGATGAAPRVIVAVNTVCAPTDEEAELRAVRAAAYAVRRRAAAAADAPLDPAREDALARELVAEEQVVHGAPAAVSARLAALAADLGADEVMLVPYELTGADRGRTLRLLAGASPQRDVPPQTRSGRVPGHPRPGGSQDEPPHAEVSLSTASAAGVTN